MKHQNKYQIQHDIDAAGKNQKVKGRFAVSQSPHGIGSQIKQNGGSDSPEDNADIGDCIFHDFRRRLQQRHHGTYQDQRERRHENGEKRTKDDADSKTSLNPFFILGAEPLGSYDGQTGGESHDKSQNKKGDASGTAYSGEGIYTDGSSYDHSVSHAVELLKNISHDQGE